MNPLAKLFLGGGALGIGLLAVGLYAAWDKNRSRKPCYRYKHINFKPQKSKAARRAEEYGTT